MRQVPRRNILQLFVVLTVTPASFLCVKGGLEVDLSSLSQSTVVTGFSLVLVHDHSAPYLEPVGNQFMQSQPLNRILHRMLYKTKQSAPKSLLILLPLKVIDTKTFTLEER